jgi:hypothetical protein
VEFDVGLMLAEQQKNAPDYFPYMYEMPRELSRLLAPPPPPPLLFPHQAGHLLFCEVLMNSIMTVCSAACPLKLWGFTSWLRSFRYLYQHRYNFTLTDLIYKIDSPLIKRSMEEWTHKDLSAWPTPQVPYSLNLLISLWNSRSLNTASCSISDHIEQLIAFCSAGVPAHDWNR